MTRDKVFHTRKRTTRLRRLGRLLHQYTPVPVLNPDSVLHEYSRILCSIQRELPGNVGALPQWTAPVRVSVHGRELVAYGTAAVAAPPSPPSLQQARWEVLKRNSGKKVAEGRRSTLQRHHRSLLPSHMWCSIRRELWCRVEHDRPGSSSSNRRGQRRRRCSCWCCYRRHHY